MVAGEAAVVDGVPILRGHHEVELRHEFIDDGNDGIALRHGEVPAGEEVVLNIDDKESFHG